MAIRASAMRLPPTIVSTWGIARLRLVEKPPDGSVDAGKIGAVDVETGENPAQPDEHRMALAPQLGQGFGRYQVALAIVDHGARDLGNDTAPVDHRAVDLDRIRNARASTADQRAI